MMHFLLFFKRDIKQIFLNPRLMILPLAFFAMSLFLISFTSADSGFSGGNKSLFFVLFILSTLGALGQNIARDYDRYFLKALQGESVSMKPYIFAKALGLTLGWTVPFWIVLAGISFFEGQFSLDLALQNLLVLVSISAALGFLYCLFDTLFLKGKHAPFLSLVLLTPFILPLLIFSLLGLEQGSFQGLFPVMGYALFISFGAFFLVEKALKY